MTFDVKFKHPMIQRIQSIYLLLAAISSGIIIFFLPLFYTSAGPHLVINDPIFFGMTVLSTLISIFSIFRYKNQSAIETAPIVVGEDSIGWQAKFYGSALSDHKGDILKMLKRNKSFLFMLF